MPDDIDPLDIAAPELFDWLNAKVPVASQTWDAMGQAEYARSFTAARTAGADVIDDIYQGLAANFASPDRVAFSDQIVPILEKKGWLAGTGQSVASRVKLIFDTNLGRARADGQFERYQRTRAVFPYLRGVTAHDERVRHPPKSPHSDHRAFDGIMLPIDHPFWASYWPPYGFRCRCYVIQMSRADLARRGGELTSEADLAARVKRLGPPVFGPPLAPMGEQLNDMVAATNDTDERMPGRPNVSVPAAVRAGDAEWQRQKDAAVHAQVQHALATLFGDDVAAANRR